MIIFIASVLGTDGNRNIPTMVMGSGAVAIDAGLAHSLILKSDGSLWAFGRQDNGRLGISKYGHRNSIDGGGVEGCGYICRFALQSCLLKWMDRYGEWDKHNGQLGVEKRVTKIGRSEF